MVLVVTLLKLFMLRLSETVECKQMNQLKLKSSDTSKRSDNSWNMLMSKPRIYTILLCQTRIVLFTGHKLMRQNSLENFSVNIF